MYQSISFFISLRYLWNSHLPRFKKIIIVLSILGISISISILIIIISIINGSEDYFKKNILSFVPHLIITNNNKCINKSDFPKSIFQFNNIQKIDEFINQKVIIKNNYDISIAEIMGVDATNYNSITNYNIKDFLYLLLPGKNNIIIGNQLAKKLNIHIGDKITLINLSDQKKIFLKNFFHRRKFKVISFFSTKNEVDYYQILMNKEDSLNFLHFSKNYITGWRIWLKDPLSLKLKKIKKTLKNFVLLDWTVTKGELFNSMKIEKYFMLFLFSLILIISIFNIFITIIIYIMEKRNAILILKTQGLTNWKIMLIFIILGSSIAIIGNLLGTIISIILIIQNDFLKFLINIFFKNINIPIIILPYQIFYINIISTLLAIITTLYPAWNAIKSKSYRIFSNE